MELNECRFYGRLTKDPDIKTLASGTKLANFGLAVNTAFTDKSGQPRENTAFLDFEAWEDNAAFVEKLKKADAVTLVSQAKVDSWTAKDGTRRNKVRFRVVKFEGAAKTKTGAKVEPMPEKATETIPF